MRNYAALQHEIISHPEIRVFSCGSARLRAVLLDSLFSSAVRTGQQARETQMHKDLNPAAAPAAKPSASAPAKLEAFWMPFTASRQFKSAPRLLAKAKDMHYWTPEGRQVLDAVAGLWCVNAGHSRPKIVRAIAEQAQEMDFAPPFNMAHPKSFELATKLVELTPEGLDKVFYTNSGSEAVD